MMTKSCVTCVFGLTCTHPDPEKRSDCQADLKYSHYVEGDPRIRLLELQRSGEINIVIGGEGEHEVNANWGHAKAYEHLFKTCEACGGLVTGGSTGYQLVLMKSYGPTFVLEWMHDKLYKISIREHNVWWTAK